MKKILIKDIRELFTFMEEHKGLIYDIHGKENGEYEVELK